MAIATQQPTCPVSGNTSTAANGGCPFSKSAASLPPAHLLADPTSVIPAEFRNITLTPEQKDLIKASIPALEAHGLDITKSFYSHMLADNPELKNIFNNANQHTFKQPQSLANSVYAYACNIDDLSPLLPVVELIAHKHCSLYVRPEQYAIVGGQLLAAIQRILGDAVTEELLGAWAAAYWMLAQIFIVREHQIYEEHPDAIDWMDFKIAKKQRESEEIISFYLEPMDPARKPLPKYKAGQYISIQLNVPELGHLQARQYSLSDTPDQEYYRVSIKREVGDHPGLISNIMHDGMNEGDLLRVSCPCGDFFVDNEKQASTAPLVLISGGVGLTALNSIMKSTLNSKTTRPISWIHGARSSGVRAFRQQIMDAAASRDNVKVFLFNDTVGPEDKQGVDYHYEGVIDLTKLDRSADLYFDNKEAEYFVCAPRQVMLIMREALLAQGVSADRIHMELFGTGGI